MSVALSLPDVSTTLSVVALIISGLTLLVGALSLRQVRKERERDVRVDARHYAIGMDLHQTHQEVELRVKVTAINFGERPEQVVRLGMESATGDLLADDTPTTEGKKMIHEPPSNPRELPRLGRVESTFPVPREEFEAGVVGFAELGTGEWVRSNPVRLDPHFEALQADILQIVREAAEEDPPPGAV